MVMMTKPIHDLLQQMKRAFKRKLEVHVSQNFGRLGTNSFPGSPSDISRRGPWEGG